MAKKQKEDPNFRQSAKEIFDSLSENEEWSWSGLAKAFVKKYGNEANELTNMIGYYLSGGE